MKTLSLLAGSLLLYVASLSNAIASTTVLDVNGTLKGLLNLQSYTFDVPTNGTYDATFTDSTSRFSGALFGIYDKIGGVWKSVGGTVNSGSFTFTGNDTLLYKAVVLDGGFPGSKLTYNIDITSVGGSTGGITTPVPEPDTWAIMLLGIGFLVYQMRPRKAQESVNIPRYS
jgi:hypothetical protein